MCCKILTAQYKTKNQSLLHQCFYNNEIDFVQVA